MLPSGTYSVRQFLPLTTPSVCGHVAIAVCSLELEFCTSSVVSVYHFFSVLVLIFHNLGTVFQ